MLAEGESSSSAVHSAVCSTHTGADLIPPIQLTLPPHYFSAAQKLWVVLLSVSRRTTRLLSAQVNSLFESNSPFWISYYRWASLCSVNRKNIRNIFAISLCSWVCFEWPWNNSIHQWAFKIFSNPHRFSFSFWVTWSIWYSFFSSLTIIKSMLYFICVRKRWGCYFSSSVSESCQAVVMPTHWGRLSS